MEPNNGLSGAKIALLVDFDNVIFGLEEPGFDIELVVNALRERGTIVLGRVYGDWYRHNRHRRRLMEQGLELVETPAFGPVIKNSADIRIALDGFEIGLLQPHIDTFAIVSGDSDFLPLIKKLQSLGRRVLVICGNRFTSDMLRRNCNEFISYENLLAQSVGATEDATTLEGAFALLHRAMAALRERGTEIRGSGVKQMMIQLNPVFSERTFGCTQFRQFLQKAVHNGIVKLGPRDKTSGEFHVLLPDEDEAPVQQKFERRHENRARRDDKLSQIAARIQAIPVEEVSLDSGVEIEVDAVADAIESDYFAGEDSEFEDGAVFSDDAFGYDPETMAQARTESPQEIAQNTIARSELLARGLRPSKRRFSGQSGRPTIAVKENERSSRPIEDDEEEVIEVEAEEVATPEVQIPIAPVAENRRLRSRRRRRSASGQITVVAEEAVPTEAPSDEAPSDLITEAEPVAISSEETANDASPVGDGPDEEAPRENIAEDAKNTDESELEFSHDLLNVEEESNVEVTEQVEAPEEAVADIQSALDELQSAASDLDESKGISVEADAPALPESSANVETSDPSGVPAKAKRRRPSRSKKAAPVAETEAVPVADDVQAEVAEAQPEVEAPVAETPVEVAIEAQAEVAPETQAEPVEAAPAKPKRRRPSRAKKSDADSEKSSE